MNDSFPMLSFPFRSERNDRDYFRAFARVLQNRIADGKNGGGAVFNLVE